MQVVWILGFAIFLAADFALAAMVGLLLRHGSVLSTSLPSERELIPA